MKDRANCGRNDGFLDNEVNRTGLCSVKKRKEISSNLNTSASLPQQIESNLRALDRPIYDLNLVGENIRRQTDLSLVENAIQKYLEFGVTIPALVNGPVQPKSILCSFKTEE